MVNFPFCKINLGLNIIAKRPDGYHNLETCFFPLPFCDVLEVVHAPEFRLVTTGLQVAGSEADNLCVKAYRLLEKDFALPQVSIHLHKTIPSGAGLAGGSSDAAHTLLLLNKKFGLNLAPEQLSEYALQLGSDCPFFLHNKPMFGSGRGEILEPVSLSLSGWYIMLVLPGIHVSTAAAFTGIVPKAPQFSIKETLQLPPGEWKHRLVNDFEHTVFVQHPELQFIKNSLYEQGAAYASLTGTGSVVYGLFPGPVSEAECHKSLGNRGLLKCFVL